MSVVVSFCLFGDDFSRMYNQGAIENAKLYKHRFPDFHLVYYLGRRIPDATVKAIRAANPRVTIIRKPDLPEDQTFTYIRFLAIRDFPKAEYIFFRDVDSRLSEREAVAMEEYLGNDQYEFHMMRDHDYHGRYLMSGMWGLHQSAFSSIRLVDDIIDHGDWYQVDQTWLELYVWPHAKRHTMVHLGTRWCVYERITQRRPFRSPRVDNGFVAQAYNADGTLRLPEHQGMYLSDKELLDDPTMFMEEYRHGRMALPGK